MITATARTSVKRRLDIDDSVTDFNDKIDEFVLSAVNRLFPIAQAEVPRAEQSVTVDSYGEAVVDMAAAGIVSARAIEVSAGGAWMPASDYYHHGTSLIIRDLNSSITRVRFYGNAPYTLATVPAHYEQAIIWFAMSEFYDFLAGNKRKYNIYDSSGARDVDNMKDQADFYERKANVYLSDRVKLYGVS